MLDQLSFSAGESVAVVFGNEVFGVDQEVINLSDGVREIPQKGTKHSLNISVSAGIIIWELFKKLSYYRFIYRNNPNRFWCRHLFDF